MGIAKWLLDEQTDIRLLGDGEEVRRSDEIGDLGNKFTLVKTENIHCHLASYHSDIGFQAKFT
jgi:hypothetical protein